MEKEITKLKLRLQILEDYNKVLGKWMEDHKEDHSNMKYIIGTLEQKAVNY